MLYVQGSWALWFRVTEIKSMEQTFSVKEESCPTAKDLCLSSICSYPYFHLFWAVVAWILVATSILFPLCYALQPFGIIYLNSKNNKKKEIKTDERGTCMVEMVCTHRRAKAVVGRVHILATSLIFVISCWSQCQWQEPMSPDRTAELLYQAGVPVAEYLFLVLLSPAEIAPVHKSLGQTFE